MYPVSSVVVLVRELLVRVNTDMCASLAGSLSPITNFRFSWQLDGPCNPAELHGGTFADQRGSYETMVAESSNSSPVGLGGHRGWWPLVERNPGTRGLRLRIIQDLTNGLPLATGGAGALVIIIKPSEVEAW